MTPTELTAAAGTLPWAGAFMTAALLQSTGRVEAAEQMALRAYQHLAEVQFDLIDDLVPPVPVAELLQIGARAIKVAKDDAVPVASIPARPKPVLRIATHHTAKRARTNANSQPV